MIDSGIGGLCILERLLENKGLDFIYLMDNKNFPFGNKPEKFLLKRCRKLVKRLIHLKAECVIIACNTLSIIATERLKKEFKIPIIGINEFVEEELKKYKSIYLIGTSNTINSNYYQKLCKKNLIRCRTRISDDLVYAIEEKLPYNDILLEIKEEFSEDAILLGCTHYIKIKDDLRSIGEIISQDDLVRLKESKKRIIYTKK